MSLSFANPSLQDLRDLVELTVGRVLAADCLISCPNCPTVNWIFEWQNPGRDGCLSFGGCFAARVALSAVLSIYIYIDLVDWELGERTAFLQRG